MNDYARHCQRERRGPFTLIPLLVRPRLRRALIFRFISEIASFRLVRKPEAEFAMTGVFVLVNEFQETERLRDLETER